MNSERTIEFLPPDSAVAPDLGQPPWQGQASTVRKTVGREAIVLDTFDQRLFRKGKALTFERAANGASVCRLRDLSGRKPVETAALPDARPPRFIWDVADRGLRSELEAIVEVRALLPQCRLRSQSYPVEGFPDTLPRSVRLHWARYELLPEHGRAREVGARLAVSWSDEDDRSARHVLDSLIDRGLLVVVENDIALRALEMCGLLPAPERPADRGDRAADERADLALKRVLSGLFETMTRNEAGILGNIDSEFLHDFRVAIRRSRALLSQLKGVLPAMTVERCRQDLAWLGQATGPARDLDVYLLEFARFRKLLPDAMRGDLAPLHALLAAKAVAEHAALVRVLNSARYRQFKARWAAFLNRDVPRRPAAPNALQPIGSLVNGRIWALYRRVSKRAGEITEDTPSDQIHELRKTCKKLRYLLEFAQDFPAADEIRKPIKDLKRLQDRLGDFQDAEVQMAYVREWFSELRQDPKVTSPSLLAVGMLLGRLDQLQRQRCGKIPAALKRFARKEDRVRFKTLFKEISPTGGVGADPIESARN